VAAYVLAGLGVIVVAAHLCGAVARRLGQPAVVGQIVAGVLLGPSLLGPKVFTWDRPWAALHCDEALEGTGIAPSITSCAFPPQASSTLAIIGQLGVAFYMFLVGLELDWDAVRRNNRAAVAVASGGLIVPLVVGLALSPLLYDDVFLGSDANGGPPSQLGFGLMIGTILTVTALPVLARILEERPLGAGPLATTAIVAGAMVTVAMFLALATATDLAQERGVSSIALRGVAASAFILFLLRVLRPLLAPLGRALEARGELGSVAFGGCLLLVLAAGVTTGRLGLTVVPGAFLAGAILPARPLLQRELGARLREVTVAVLLPVFLAYSGLNTDFTVLGWSPAGGLALLLVAAVVTKWAGTAIGARMGGIRGAEAHTMCALMNCRGLLVLVVGLAAVDAGVVSPTLQVGAVLIALVTTLMTAPLLDRFVPQLVSLNGASPHSASPNGSSPTHLHVQEVTQHREDQP
jgi:Kef-type K+ transport system membrane component KefB